MIIGDTNCTDKKNIINNVKQGEWYTYVQINKNNGRCGRLFATIKTKNKIYDDDKYHWKLKGSVGVDTGQAGIFDLKYYRDDNNVSSDDIRIDDNKPGDNKYMENFPGDKWYSMCCKCTEYDGVNVRANIIKNGVISNSGVGRWRIRFLCREKK